MLTKSTFEQIHSKRHRLCRSGAVCWRLRGICIWRRRFSIQSHGNATRSGIRVMATLVSRTSASDPEKDIHGVCGIVILLRCTRRGSSRMSCLDGSRKSEGGLCTSHSLCLKININRGYGSLAPVAKDTRNSGRGRHFKARG